MKKSLLVLSLCLLFVAAGRAEGPDDWKTFRGPTGQGHAFDAKIPLTWSETKNVTWKTEVPGRAWSSPVVLDGQIWFTNAPAEGHKLSLVCLDAETGKKLHDILLFDVAEHEKRFNTLNSYASPTPVLEKGRVYAHFGRDGTAAVDTATGKILWKRDGIKIAHMEGAGSSPRLAGGVLVLTMDGTDEQFLIGLDPKTGKTLWRTDRSYDMKQFPKHARKAYTTPLSIVLAGHTELISGGAQCAMAYDPRTGKELWRVKWKTGWSNGTTPVSHGATVFIHTGYGRGKFRQVLAIQAGGRGDVTDTNIQWRYDKGVSMRTSALAAEGQYHMISDTGILTVLDIKTGREIYRHRVGGEFSASPIYANGHIYLFDQEGKTTVYKPGPAFKAVAVNRLDEGFMASAAVVGDALFLRTKTHVYRIEK